MTISNHSRALLTLGNHQKNDVVNRTIPISYLFDSIGGYVVHFGICEVSTESAYKPMHFAAGQNTQFQIIRKRCTPLKTEL